MSARSIQGTEGSFDAAVWHIWLSTNSTWPSKNAAFLCRRCKKIPASHPARETKNEQREHDLARLLGLGVIESVRFIHPRSSYHWHANTPPAFERLSHWSMPGPGQVVAAGFAGSKGVAVRQSPRVSSVTSVEAGRSALNPRRLLFLPHDPPAV